MYATFLIGTLFVTTLAAPLAQSTTPSDWTPAAGSTVKCDKTSGYTIDGYRGILLDTLVTNACKMLIPCAYSDRSADLICTQATDMSLEKQKTTIQPANVMYEGNSQSGWAANFTVTPPAQQPETGSRWTKEDCKGYFVHMLDKWEPEGCHSNKGMGIGSITVGDASSLKETVFEVTIVKQQ